MDSCLNVVPRVYCLQERHDIQRDFFRSHLKQLVKSKYE